MPDLLPTLVDLFWSHVDKSAGTDACWPWTARRDRDGYGRSSSLLAHRRAYVVLRGAIPNDLTVDHLCFNRACCNPSHMELVSRVENLRRQQSAIKGACKNGHPFDAQNTYRRTPSGGGHRSCRACNYVAVQQYRARQERRIA